MNLFPIRKSQSILPRWDPLMDIASLQDQFNQIFGRVGRLSEPTMLAETLLWSPSMDVVENEKEIKLRIDVPGMETKDLHVEVDDQALVVRGERKNEVKEEKDNYLHIERGYGTFMRRFPLPEYVDDDSIRASCKNGVLEVRLNKLPGKKKAVKEISVN